ncbi:MAG: hypothetical protein RL304_1173 [Verrucomicrobiota bacterium]
MPRVILDAGGLAGVVKAKGVADFVGGGLGWPEW